MKKSFCLLSVLLVGCASYPNYYIKDSTITNQQQTVQPQNTWGGYSSPVFIPGVTPNYYYYSPGVYSWGGWGGWGGWGWNRGWGCW